MHQFHSCNLPDIFNHLFTPVNQVHCHATSGAYFWQMAHTKYGKRSLRHLRPKIWDKIDPFLHDSSQLTFKKQYRDVLSLPMMTNSMVLKQSSLKKTYLQPLCRQTSANNKKSPEDLIYLLDLKPGDKRYEITTGVAKRTAIFEE